MSATISVRLAGTLGSFRLESRFEAPMRGITALFGPSGCGKTSVLRSLAGLNRVPGRIAVGDEIWQDEVRFVPVHRRPLGYVFQEPSLFPHLTVRGNLRYGQRRVPGAHAVRLDEVVALLGLEALIDRSPDHLSGGERQRVSIGRALLSQPRLLLMDEPLSALDRIAKDEILPYFERLHTELSVPILLVTHDISEVERLADHLVLMRDGAVLSSGPLNEALTDPRSPFGRARNLASVLPGRVVRQDADGITVLAVGSAELLAIAPGAKPGTAVRVRIGANDVSLARTPHPATSILNAIPARILGIDPVGEAEANVRLSLGEGDDALFTARISARSLRELGLQPGESVIASIKGVSLLSHR